MVTLVHLMLLGACQQSPASQEVPPDREKFPTAFPCLGKQWLHISGLLDERDPMACNKPDEPFSDYIFTRGGAGQNSQATVTVCVNQLKLSALYESEAEDVDAGLRVEGCDGVHRHSDFGPINLDRPNKTWRQFKIELEEAWSELQTNCKTTPDVNDKNLERIKPAFDQIVDVLAQEREANAQTY